MATHIDHPRARSHAVRPLPQDGPRGLPSHVSREAAAFEVMLTRGYSGTRAGAFIIPIPGAIARAMKRRPRCGPRPNGRAQRCPCPSCSGASTTMSLPLLLWCGVRADRRSPMRIDSRLRRAVQFRCRRRPTTNFTRPRTKSSNPVPSSEESCEWWSPLRRSRTAIQVLRALEQIYLRTGHPSSAGLGIAIELSSGGPRSRRSSSRSGGVTSR